MAKIDYAKAKRNQITRDAKRLADFETRKRRELAPAGPSLQQQQTDYFVAKHQLHCFKCKRSDGPWATARREPSGHRWALCQTCAEKKKTSG